MAADPEVLVTSDFSEATTSDTPMTSDLSTFRNSFPWSSPTEVYTNPQSSAIVGMDPLGNLKPPYVVMKVEPTPEDPNAVGGGAVIVWRFPAGELASGRYEVSVKVTPLQEKMKGGAVRLHFDDSKGTDSRNGFVSIWLAGDAFLAKGDQEGPLFQKGKTYGVKFLIDLDENIWSVFVDNVEVVAEAQLPQTEEESKLSLKEIVLATNGSNETTPNAEVAFSEFRLARLK